MWNKRILSQTHEYPCPQDVFRALLSRMIEKASESSRMQVEVIAKGGWFNNLLCGKEPGIEIAFVNQLSLQLTPRISKSKHALMPGISSKWRNEESGVWTVPTSDAEDLVLWAETCLAAVSGTPGYRVSGWLEEP